MAQKRKVSPQKSRTKKGTLKKGSPKRKPRRKIAGITRKQILIALGILVATTFISYSPILNAGFVDIDDAKLILNKGPAFINNPLGILQYLVWTAL